MNPISNRFSWWFQKNRHYLDTFIFRRAPEFTYRSPVGTIRGETPVFTFHLALPEWFEEQCQFLVENSYRTLTCDEMLFNLQNGKRPVGQSIMLTFDDGLKHVWTVAYPILKKYNLKATCFLIPGCISAEDHRVRPNLEDFWSGTASMDEIMRLEGNGSNLATWPEIELMHNSGVIDFQSHTMYHSLVFTSPKVFDFVNPQYNVHFYGNTHVPLYQVAGRDNVEREPLPGMPVYTSEPRMLAVRRYFDDERLREHCIQTVLAVGPEAFFEKKNWRAVLRDKVHEFRGRHQLDERFEEPAERDLSVYRELRESKEMIEAHLPGKKVTHLCFPWYEAASFAVVAAVKAGFEACYFGTVSGRRTNRPGDSPLSVARVEDIFLERLPGKGRKSVFELLKKVWDLRQVGQMLKPPA
jgi:peptidoglycan/xylan/chitin deacetylase (PgdA/CDA1 family)